MKLMISLVWVTGLILASTSVAGELISTPQRAQTNSALIRTDTPKPLPANGFLSTWFLEVVKLEQARIPDEITLAFVTNCTGTFNLGPDQIVYLKQIGTSSQVINAMIAQDQTLNAGVIPMTAATSPTPLENFLRMVPANFFASSEPTVSSASIPPGESIVVPEAEPEWPFVFDDRPGAPEQPDTVRVRLPYPVKLTDTILMLHMPCL
jgi:hypothetical protein